MVIPTDATFKPHPAVVCSTLPNGEAVLLHTETKSYYSLNQTGARIWELITEQCSVSQISQGIVNEFDVDSKSASEFVIQLTSELVDEKLVLLYGDS